ncbi:hypothetical protein C8R43DRAFT_1234364 [Mycena crocata]|nr:hypothetical protein C8R43DRAFT_1234364 [Mycena crocata]
MVYSHSFTSSLQALTSSSSLFAFHSTQLLNTEWTGCSSLIHATQRLKMIVPSVHHLRASNSYPSKHAQSLPPPISRVEFRVPAGGHLSPLRDHRIHNVSSSRERAEPQTTGAPFFQKNPPEANDALLNLQCIVSIRALLASDPQSSNTTYRAPASRLNPQARTCNDQSTVSNFNNPNPDSARRALDFGAGRGNSGGNSSMSVSLLQSDSVPGAPPMDSIRLGARALLRLDAHPTQRIDSTRIQRANLTPRESTQRIDSTRRGGNASRMERPAHLGSIRRAWRGLGMQRLELRCRVDTDSHAESTANRLGTLEVHHGGLATRDRRQRFARGLRRAAPARLCHSTPRARSVWGVFHLRVTRFVTDSPRLDVHATPCVIGLYLDTTRFGKRSKPPLASTRAGRVPKSPGSPIDATHESPAPLVPFDAHGALPAPTDSFGTRPKSLPKAPLVSTWSALLAQPRTHSTWRMGQ